MVKLSYVCRIWVLVLEKSRPFRRTEENKRSLMGLEAIRA